MTTILCENPERHASHAIVRRPERGGEISADHCVGNMLLEDEALRYVGVLWTEPIAYAPAAAYGLKRGAEVDYCPGDGTRYITLLLTREHDPRRWLVFPNLGHAVVQIVRTPISVRDYCLFKHAPVGSWRALRPLLAALGAAHGPFHMIDFDGRAEADERANGCDGEPLDQHDAILGRVVRRVVAKQTREGLPPGGEPLD